jgi:hypothetical protein
MSDDLLINAERPSGDKPARVAERDPPPEAGYFPGSATGHVLYWRWRALAAEAEVYRLRGLVALARGWMARERVLL